MKLSILILTFAGREAKLARLLAKLEPQMTRDSVYAVFDDHAARRLLGLAEDFPLTIGHKRNAALRAASGDYVCFFDDDDLPAPDYVAAILEAIDTKPAPDVIGFKLRFFIDGVYKGTSIHSLACGEWSEGENPDHTMKYLRTPNHLNPIRREIALAVGYKPMNRGEDADYSDRLFRKYGARLKEHFIDAYLYDYLFVSHHRRREKADLNAVIA